MYNCLMNLYLIGFPDEDAALLKDIDPLPSFSHIFTSSVLPETDSIRKADAIFIYSNQDDASVLVECVLEHKSDDAQVVLIASHKAFSALGELADALTDFWEDSLNSCELIFRFNRWQKSCKRDMDFWETRQFLDATIDSIPSLVWYKTRDGVHEKVNSSFCKTVNKTKERVQGQRHAYIWDVEEDDPACIESENEVMRSEKTCVSEEAVQVGDSTKLLTTYKSPLYDIDGSVMGTVGVGIDITQERAYENSLIEKNNTLETIFTALDCGVLTHSLDGSRILGVNKKALDILGFKSESDLREKGFDMVASTVVEEDAERLKHEIMELAEVGDNLSTEYSVCHEDGEILHIMGNIKVIEKAGEKFYQRFLLDITTQKALEAEKDRRSKDLIQALSEEFIVVCAFDVESEKGEVLQLSKEDVELDQIFTGDLSLSETIEAYIDARVQEEDAQMLREALSPEGITEELRLKRRFDRIYHIRKNGITQFRQVTVVRSGGWETRREAVIGFKNVDQQIRDELEQKTLLEEALANANRANAAKSTFLLNMSHDIRTPMNAILGFTTLASSHINQPDKVEGYLDKIKSSSDHLLNLINDILDVSRIEHGKVKLDESRCNIVDVLDELYSMLHHEAENKGLTLNVDCSKVIHPEVVCDSLKVNQILLNLLGNSIKFTDSGGSIFASVEELPEASEGFGKYRIIVEDTGIGMPEDFLKLIFAPFERVENQTVNGIKGSGLGMAIVKSLVDMMHGTIEVESELGHGSRFTINVVFKIADDISENDGKSEKDPIVFTPDRASKYHILLVDDNPLNREIAEDILLDVGFQVSKAENGQDALDKLEEAGAGYFDIVLMDIQMPVMNGYEAAAAIRSFDDPILAQIPILAVTADAFEEDRKMALKHGMNGHLPKPIEVSKLFDFLDSLLS